MGEVAADPGLLAKGVERGARGAREQVVEAQLVVHEIADRLHAAPAHGRLAELVPGELHQLAVDFAVAAGEQELQRADGQLAGVMLPGVPGGGVGQAGVGHHGVVREAHGLDTGRHVDAAAVVAEVVDEVVHLHRGRDVEVLGRLQVGLARRMHVQQVDQRHGRGDAEFDVVADLDEHVSRR